MDNPERHQRRVLNRDGEWVNENDSSLKENSTDNGELLRILALYAGLIIISIILILFFFPCFVTVIGVVAKCVAALIIVYLMIYPMFFFYYIISCDKTRIDSLKGGFIASLHIMLLLASIATWIIVLK